MNKNKTNTTTNAAAAKQAANLKFSQLAIGQEFIGCSDVSSHVKVGKREFVRPEMGDGVIWVFAEYRNGPITVSPQHKIRTAIKALRKHTLELCTPGSARYAAGFRDGK